MSTTGSSRRSAWAVAAGVATVALVAVVALLSTGNTVTPQSSSACAPGDALCDESVAGLRHASQLQAAAVAEEAAGAAEVNSSEPQRDAQAGNLRTAVLAAAGKAEEEDEADQPLVSVAIDATPHAAGPRKYVLFCSRLTKTE